MCPAGFTYGIVLFKKPKKRPFMGFESKFQFMVTLIAMMMRPVLWMTI